MATKIISGVTHDRLVKIPESPARQTLAPLPSSTIPSATNTDDYVKLSNGDFVLKEDYFRLPVDQQFELMYLGVDRFNERQAERAKNIDEYNRDIEAQIAKLNAMPEPTLEINGEEAFKRLQSEGKIPDNATYKGFAKTDTGITVEYEVPVKNAPIIPTYDKEPPFGTFEYTEWYYNNTDAPGYTDGKKYVSVDRATGKVTVYTVETGEGVVSGSVDVGFNYFASGKASGEIPANATYKGFDPTTSKITYETPSQVVDTKPVSGETLFADKVSKGEIPDNAKYIGYADGVISYEVPPEPLSGYGAFTKAKDEGLIPPNAKFEGYDLVTGKLEYSIPEPAMPVGGHEVELEDIPLAIEPKRLEVPIVKPEEQYTPFTPVYSPTAVDYLKRAASNWLEGWKRTFRGEALHTQEELAAMYESQQKQSGWSSFFGLGGEPVVKFTDKDGKVHYGQVVQGEAPLVGGKALTKTAKEVATVRKWEDVLDEIQDAKKIKVDWDKVANEATDLANAEPTSMGFRPSTVKGKSPLDVFQDEPTSSLFSAKSSKVEPLDVFNQEVTSSLDVRYADMRQFTQAEVAAKWVAKASESAKIETLTDVAKVTTSLAPTVRTIVIAPPSITPLAVPSQTTVVTVENPVTNTLEIRQPTSGETLAVVKPIGDVSGKEVYEIQTNPELKQVTQLATYEYLKALAEGESKELAIARTELVTANAVETKIYPLTVDQVQPIQQLFLSPEQKLMVKQATDLAVKLATQITTGTATVTNLDLETQSKLSEATQLATQTQNETQLQTKTQTATQTDVLTERQTERLTDEDSQRRPKRPILPIEQPDRAITKYEGVILPGTITTKMGTPKGAPFGMWYLLKPPNYDKLYYMNTRPNGAKDYGSGEGSAYKNVQVIGNIPDSVPDKDIDIGIVYLKIRKGSDGKMHLSFRRDESDTYKGQIKHREMPNVQFDSGNLVDTRESTDKLGWPFVEDAISQPKPKPKPKPSTITYQPYDRYYLGRKLRPPTLGMG